MFQSPWNRVILYSYQGVKYGYAVICFNPLGIGSFCILCGYKASLRTVVSIPLESGHFVLSTTLKKRLASWFQSPWNRVILYLILKGNKMSIIKFQSPWNRVILY